MSDKVKFPEIIDNQSLRLAIDNSFEKFLINWGEQFEIAFLPVLKLIRGSENLLINLPWYVVFSLITFITYLATKTWNFKDLKATDSISDKLNLLSMIPYNELKKKPIRKQIKKIFIGSSKITAPIKILYVLIKWVFLIFKFWAPTLASAIMIFACGVIGLWEPAMATIALMLIATILAIIIGVPLGIGMARANWVEKSFLPVLDIMQTMPIFVYLIPFVMIFGPGKVPALLATLVFALPPVIRLTNLGIRHVDPEVMEAVEAFGATPKQKLLTAQLPLAMPTIMAGINQTTLLALSMVVIASMIGAGGLGYQVLQGVQRLEIGRGF